MNLKLLTSAVAVLLAALLLAGCNAAPDRPPIDTKAKAKAKADAKAAMSIADQTLADCIIDRQLQFRRYRYDQRPQSNIDVSRSSIAYAHLNCRRPGRKAGVIHKLDAIPGPPTRPETKRWADGLSRRPRESTTPAICH